MDSAIKILLIPIIRADLSQQELDEVVRKILALGRRSR